MKAIKKIIYYVLGTAITLAMKAAPFVFIAFMLSVPIYAIILKLRYG